MWQFGITGETTDLDEIRAICELYNCTFTQEPAGAYFLSVSDISESLDQKQALAPFVTKLDVMNGAVKLKHSSHQRVTFSGVCKKSNPNGSTNHYVMITEALHLELRMGTPSISINGEKLPSSDEILAKKVNQHPVLVEILSALSLESLDGRGLHYLLEKMCVVLYKDTNIKNVLVKNKLASAEDAAAFIASVNNDAVIKEGPRHPGRKKPADETKVMTISEAREFCINVLRAAIDQLP